MTTIREAMTEAAYREFDEACAEQERLARMYLEAAGKRAAEIEQFISDYRARVAPAREMIPSNTVDALKRAGVPMETNANVWQ